MQNDVIEDIWKQLKNSGLPIHSFLADRGGTVLKEAYQAPYTDKDLHRMFSITKSFCSLAVGYLYADGMLSLDDTIINYFPEYCSSKEIHPWLKEMTIRHMLSMETCHTTTTYKIDKSKNWVKSFFTTPPSHRSGQVFLYDTSSSHTLAALVKKLTGKGVLDYLREKCLDKIGFSREAYILLDPFGSEMGGSGLMAFSKDLLKVGRYCMDTIQKGSDAFADYLREAVSFQVPTLHAGQTVDEQQGYGYQFWRIRNGFAMYGLGGQYVLFYPQLDMVFVITADTQKIKGGNQIMLDLVYDAVVKMQDPMRKPGSPTGPETWDTAYKLLNNPNGFTKLSLSFGSSDGILLLSNREDTFRIPFAFDAPKVSILDKYNERIATQGMWADNNTLYLPIQVVGECVGSIHFLIRLSEEKITVWMKKIEETFFSEFQGFLEGEKEA